MLGDLEERFNSLEEGSKSFVEQVMITIKTTVFHLTFCPGETFGSSANNERMVWLLIFSILAVLFLLAFMVQ
jgi:hypothetical protein